MSGGGANCVTRVSYSVVPFRWFYFSIRFSYPLVMMTSTPVLPSPFRLIERRTLIEPMIDEQRSFNEQVAVIERNKQSALAALRH